jgi:protoporphyrinogen/coproporphyrinogen III oxidase
VRVAIVGGGFAGLLTAHALLQRGIDDLVVLDRSDHPGGVARSISRDGYILEPAVGSLTLPHPHLSAILAPVSNQLRPAAETARIRHVWTRGRLVTPPTGPRAALAPIVPLRAKLRALLEPLVTEPPGGDDVSLDEFCRRRLGNEFGGVVSWLAASGVFAGDPADLSARASFPALTNLVAAEGSLLLGGLRRMRGRPPGVPRPSIHVPVSTMADLAAALAAHLDDRFRSGHDVDVIRRDGSRWILDGSERLVADEVVLACRPDAAARMVDGPIAALLDRAQSATTVVIGLGGVGPSIDGFGILTGPDAATATRGILLESSYAPHRAPTGHFLLKVIAGGDPPARLPDSDDADLIENVGSEVARILRRDVDASFVEVVRHQPGIPQYRVGHDRWLASVEAEAPPGLHLTGWGYRGVGISHLATDATRVAARIAP